MNDPKKCIVHGCTNRDDQGEMRGELCTPCHIMLTTGKISPHGLTFMHELAKSNQQRLDTLEKIKGLATRGRYYE